MWLIALFLHQHRFGIFMLAFERGAINIMKSSSCWVATFRDTDFFISSQILESQKIGFNFENTTFLHFYVPVTGFR